MSRRVFGPVSSRRLGLSLGVDPLPMKSCSFDCPYCEIGRPTSPTTVTRGRFFPVEQILAEVAEALASGPRPEVVTLSGSGEPTLYEGLGELAEGLRPLAPEIPLVLLTNGSLLWDPAVRRDCLPFDLIVPSLDAGTEAVWQVINRPDPALRFDEYVDGLAAMSRERRGRLELEIMVIPGMNDSPEELEALARHVARIRPDAVQLNTVVRPGVDRTLVPASPEVLERIAARFAAIAPTKVIASRAVPAGGRGLALVDRLLGLIALRPVPAEEAAAALGSDLAGVRAQLEVLVASGRAEALPDPAGGNRTYYRLREVRR
jgi:wyosine [tRNA(Phe)-imidazoG37] synthetase (radical SAM superfamily)